MGRLADAHIDRQVSDIAGRVMAVRDAATVTSTFHVDCSACGPLTGPLRHGISIHAVNNPGHIVTATQVVTTIYEDKGKPLNAGTT